MNRHPLVAGVLEIEICVEARVNDRIRGDRQIEKSICAQASAGSDLANIPPIAPSRKRDNQVRTNRSIFGPQMEFPFCFPGSGSMPGSWRCSKLVNVRVSILFGSTSRCRGLPQVVCHRASHSRASFNRNRCDLAASKCGVIGDHVLGTEHPFRLCSAQEEDATGGIGVRRSFGQTVGQPEPEKRDLQMRPPRPSARRR